MKKLYLGLIVLAVVTVAVIAACGSSSPSRYPVHTNISTTVFWVGEPADAANAWIANSASAWDSNWQTHFGGVDSPDHRQHGGDWPLAFRPQENPFYVALPYNDHDANGNVKGDVRQVYWYDPAHPPTAGTSTVKNRWVAITYKGRTAYAQWEDVGPMYETDLAYVFGSADPKYAPSGLDISPATANYLHFNGQGKTTWHFVNAADVPSGPWSTILTTSQVRNN